MSTSMHRYVTIFSTGGKFHPVSNLTELHALIPAACSLCARGLLLTFLKISLASCSKAWREEKHSSNDIIVTSPSDLWPHQCCGWSWQRFPRRECLGSEPAAPLSHSPQPSWPPSHTCCRLAIAPHLKKHAGEGGSEDQVTNHTRLHLANSLCSH